LVIPYSLFRYVLFFPYVLGGTRDLATSDGLLGGDRGDGVPRPGSPETSRHDAVRSATP